MAEIKVTDAAYATSRWGNGIVSSLMCSSQYLVIAVVVSMRLRVSLSGISSSRNVA